MAVKGVNLKWKKGKHSDDAVGEEERRKGQDKEQEG